jgi:hypothetical protein
MQFRASMKELTGAGSANEPKNSSYPGAASTGGGVGKAVWPTMRWQM